jgi:gliding motility-associated-like protein
LINLFATASASPSDTICIGTPLNFINTSTGAATYIWDFGDGTATTTTSNPSHNYTAPGIFNVSLVAINPLSCNGTDTTHLQITVKPFPVANLGNDTTICGTTNMILNAGNAGCHYLWSTGDTVQTITVTVAGTYSVVVNNGNCSATDTININHITQPPLGNDTSLCMGSQLILNAANNGSNYIWNTGAVTQTITAATSGTYWVVASIGTCSQTDTVNVTFIPVPSVNLGRDTILCPSVTILLDAANAGDTYIWSTGASSQTITVNSSGTYWAVANNGNCSDADTINVNYLTKPSLGNDTILCSASTLTLTAGTANTGAAFLWSTGDTTSFITVIKQGEYWVHVSDRNCAFADSILVTGAMDDPPMYVPNCFSPNGDGLNDTFKPQGPEGNFTSFDMKIFDRWGELIYESYDMSKGWNGMYKNDIVSLDVYVWVIDYHTLCSGDKNIHEVGHVLVLK